MSEFISDSLICHRIPIIQAKEMVTLDHRWILASCMAFFISIIN